VDKWDYIDSDNIDDGDYIDKADFDLIICMKIDRTVIFSIKVDHYVTMLTTYVFWWFIWYAVSV
jgi:hypothetical protein